jgi:hypothetical protein
MVVLLRSLEWQDGNHELVRLVYSCQMTGVKQICCGLVD